MLLINVSVADLQRAALAPKRAEPERLVERHHGGLGCGDHCGADRRAATNAPATKLVAGRDRGGPAPLKENQSGRVLRP